MSQLLIYRPRTPQISAKHKCPSPSRSSSCGGDAERIFFNDDLATKSSFKKQRPSFLHECNTTAYNQLLKQVQTADTHIAHHIAYFFNDNSMRNLHAVEFACLYGHFHQNFSLLERLIEIKHTVPCGLKSSFIKLMYPSIPAELLTALDTLPPEMASPIPLHSVRA